MKKLVRHIMIEHNVDRRSCTVTVCRVNDPKQREYTPGPTARMWLEVLSIKYNHYFFISEKSLQIVIFRYRPRREFYVYTK